LITKADLGKKLKEIFENVDPKDQADLSQVGQLFLQYIREHVGEFDEGVQEFFDKILEKFLPEAKRVIDEMPEGKEKRKAKRIYKIATGKHFEAESLIKILEQPARDEKEDSEEIRKIFINSLQNILDLLSDAVEPSRKGIAELAKFGLFYLCIDELLAAFHLAQHSFVSQAYSHLRTILEALDKIELFNQKPEWAELWASVDPRQKREQLKDLSPASIREKLGGERYDPFYSCFSEFGPHGTFRTIQTRSARKPELVDGRPQIHFWVGGCPFEHNIMFINSFLLFTLGLLLSKIGSIYAHLLNREETREIAIQFMEESKRFYEKYFLPWAEKEGLDVGPLMEYLKKIPKIFGSSE
jgi:hypothetical protein